ncbi:MAG: hypothetical protein CVV49_11645 [Spirochaetae bacterium HGW-Spirochaetae-5]|nr:MAG: hypothetical protein CVV49_11645 [Spirochaetae bacterium HGW-Spirochaetae-5]
MFRKLLLKNESVHAGVLLKNSAILLFTTAAAALLSCSDFKFNKVFIAFYQGSVTIQKNGSLPVQVQVKDQINNDDIIRTGEKSCLVVQSTDGIIIRFEQNTEAQILSLKNKTKKIINLSNGKILSSVSKLKKGEEFSIMTPSTVASVRGTEFLTAFNGRDSIVAVGNGKVSVKRLTGSKDEKSVETGFTAIAPGKNSNLNLRKISIVETLELSKFKKTPMVERIEKKTPEELKEIFKETMQCDEQINEEIKENLGLTFEEMKAKYGRIDVLYLYNGTEVEGVIAARGTVYKMVTKTGIVMVDSKDIKGTETKR